MIFLFGLYGVQSEFNKYKFENYNPQLNPCLNSNTNIFEEIAKKDIFYLHPYQTFDSIVVSICHGSEDQNILAIKQSLYRVSSDSPITHALIKAAKNGK